MICLHNGCVVLLVDTLVLEKKTVLINTGILELKLKSVILILKNLAKTKRQKKQKREKSKSKAKCQHFDSDSQEVCQKRETNRKIKNLFLVAAQCQ